MIMLGSYVAIEANVPPTTAASTGSGHSERSAIGAQVAAAIATCSIRIAGPWPSVAEQASTATVSAAARTTSRLTAPDRSMHGSSTRLTVASDRRVVILPAKTAAYSPGSTTGRHPRCTNHRPPSSSWKTSMLRPHVVTTSQ